MQLIAYDLVIPLYRTFATSTGVIDHRRVVLISLSDGGHTGWGEAAPYPGVTPESAEDVITALAGWDGRLEALPATAAAAVDEARHDLAARRAAKPLYQVLGGTRRPLIASAAVGLAPMGDTLAAVEEAVNAGFGAIKLKVAPGDDAARVRTVRNRFPDVLIGLDANGAYRSDDRDLLVALDRLGITYLEQPLAADDLAGHAELRRRLSTPICLDETIDSVERAGEVLAAGAADLICVKPARLGITAAVAIARLTREAGVELKASGLLETSVGRAHTMAVGTLPGFAWFDLAPASWFLQNDVAESPGTLDGGSMTPIEGPGIGFEPSAPRLAGLSRATVEIEVAAI